MEVRIENLTKVFEGQKGAHTTAVDNMSFVIPDGKLVGLLGPSGCGKSTTLYMIAGLHKPTSGHIYFGDEDVTNVPPENRGIGLVFQNYALYPHFTVMQNICFPLDNVRLPGATGAQKDGVASAKAALDWAKQQLSADEKLQSRQKAEADKPEDKRNKKIVASEPITEEKLAADKADIENAEQSLARAQEELAEATKAFEHLKNGGDEGAKLAAVVAEDEKAVSEAKAKKEATEELEKKLADDKAALAKVRADGAAKAAELDRHKLSKADKVAIAHEMAKIVDIERYLERKPKELSGGQQQRVAIARALSKKPGVLLLDEPLSNLDARLRLQTREEIKRIQRTTGITTVFVTHDQEEAMSISDIIVVMKLGVIQQIGEPQYVYDEPANLFVAKFLGSPAINTFEGEIKDGKLYVDGKLFDDDPVYKKPYEAKVYEDVKVAAKPVEEKKENGFAKVCGKLFSKKKKAVKEDENPDVALLEHKFHVEERSDRKVVIGVRPEAFKLADSDRVLPVDIDIIQHIGRDISLLGKIHDQDKSHLRIIIPSELRDKVQATGTQNFGAKRFYVFEEGGERIK
jgi:multiple sugar transport system ATP-binding protein